jgi:hypothetical protein
MIIRIVLSLALAVTATHAQTERPAPPATTIPKHIAEPIVIRDSSVKIDIYSTSDTAVVVEKPDTVIANGAGANEATLLVPTRIIGFKTGKGGKTVLGRLQLRSARAHPTIAVRRYVYEIEKLEKGSFAPYSELVFQLEEFSWRISPKGTNPLNLIGCTSPVALSGAWANHFQSTCEYGYRDLHLRLGSVTIEPLKGAPTKINLGTGCSEFRIEPITHPRHRLTFDHPPCAGLRLDARVSFPKVQVKGVKSITAIDVSLAKQKSANGGAGPQGPDSQK